MNVKPVKTHKIIPQGDENVLSLLDRYITSLEEKNIIAITSKVIAILQGRIVKKHEVDKNKLIESEADQFIPPEKNKHGFYLTIKNNVLIPSAGIDESNAGKDGVYYVLWPKNIQQSANEIRLFLKKKFGLKYVGVIITDSTTAPMRAGVRGIAIAHCGFVALNDYIGKPDIFGRKLEVTKANVADALATSAVLEMGEGSEQTPIAIITDIPYIQFQDNNPTQDEIADIKISLDNDMFAPILKSVKWERKNDTQ